MGQVFHSSGDIILWKKNDFKPTYWLSAVVLPGFGLRLAPGSMALM